LQFAVSEWQQRPARELLHGPPAGGH